MSEIAPNLCDALGLSPNLNQAGLYHAELPGHWNAPIFPSGGVTSALAVKAMEQELGQSHQQIRTFQTMFVATLPPGPVDVHTRPLRIGKRMSQMQADLRPAGDQQTAHLVTAAFGESREGFDFNDCPAPDVDTPENYPGPAEVPAGARSFQAPFFQNIEQRRVKFFMSFEEGWEGGTAECVRWMRYKTEPRLADGRIDRLSLIGLADTMPAALGQFLGPGFPVFHAPSVDLTMRFFSDTEEEWTLARSRIHWAGDGYASGEVSLWDGQRRLLAHATQLMLIRFPRPGEFDGV